MSPFGVFVEALIATFASLGRAVFAIALSVVIGWFLAYAAVKSRPFESLFLVLVHIFESLPVIAFFPAVLTLLVHALAPPLGVEFAVDFLVFTAVAWNIWVGEYEAIKSTPQSLKDVAEMLGLGFWGRLKYLLIPATLPRVAGNAFISYAMAMFYIVTSEVVSIGREEYEAFGIGSLIAEFMREGRLDYALIALAALSLITIVIVLFVLRPLTEWSLRREPILRVKLVGKYGRHKASPSVTIVRPKAIKWRRTWRRGIPNFLKKALVAFIVIAMALSLTYALTLNRQFLLVVFEDLAKNLLLYLRLLSLDLIRITIVLLLAVLTAVVLSYLTVTKRRLEPVLIPIFQVIASIPIPAYLPLIAAWFVRVLRGALGIGLAFEIFILVITYLSMAWYVIYNAYIGAKAIPESLWDVADNLRLSLWHKLTRLIVPGSMTMIITGCMSAFASAWGGLQLAEYVNIHGVRYKAEGLMGLMVEAMIKGDLTTLISASLLLACFSTFMALTVWRMALQYAVSKFSFD